MTQYEIEQIDVIQIGRPESRQAEEATVAALRDPRVGDEFHEMFSFWVLVLDVTPTRVLWFEVAGKGWDGKARVASRDEFYKHFLYGSIPGSWMSLNRRGLDFKDLAEHYWPEVLDHDTLPLCEATAAAEAMEANPI